METHTTALLDVQNLRVDYNAANGTVHAVSDVSFTLQRGEILGLAGESGCGKSTLAYAIARLLRPPAVIAGGSVIYTAGPPSDGAATQKRRKSDTRPEEPMDILKFSQAQLRAFRWNELAIVFQSAMNALNPVMKIGTQIMDVLQTHRPDMGSDARKQRAIELLKLVGIAPDRLNSYPHELSGGMRQRTVIAIALALQPQLIIMDEPTTALDVVVQREILELISSLCKKFNTSLIFITHDLSLLIEMADRIAIMYAGKIIEQASSQDIYLHPRHPYSYGLLNSFPTLQGARRRMAGIPGSPPDLRDVPSGCTFNPRCPLASDICTSIVPVLQPAVPHKPDQITACHLYNPMLNPTLPTTSDLAAKYETLLEGSSVQ